MGGGGVGDGAQGRGGERARARAGLGVRHVGPARDEGPARLWSAPASRELT